MKCDPKDVPQFKEEVCRVECILKGKCIDDGKDDHWFLMCPHFFNWKIGYVSFVAEQLKWQAEHPEEQEEKRKQNLELAKKLREEKKKAKKDEKV